MERSPVLQQRVAKQKQNRYPDTNGPSMSPPGFSLSASTAQMKAEDSPIQRTEDLSITAGELTATGEGSDAETKWVHWPHTDASGVTLGKGYDIGSRTESQVVAELMAAGMGETQAKKISKGAGKKGQAAGDWVTANKTSVGEISREVQYTLLATMLTEYTDKAKTLATSTTATKDGSGYYTNARGREINDGVDAGTYVLSEAQWNALHPAMVEFVTDLKYQGGYYLYGRIAEVNKALIENDGDHLAQFKAVRELFKKQDDENMSYMDRYGKRIGEGTGSTENFFGQDATGATTRRNRVRLSYLNRVIGALEAGGTVTVGGAVGLENENETSNESSSTTTTTTVETTPSTPTTTTTPDTPTSSGNTYVVQSGESLGILAKKLNTTIDALKAVNQDKLKTWGSVQGFEAGATINVPTGATVPSSKPETPTGSEEAPEPIPEPVQDQVAKEEPGMMSSLLRFAGGVALKSVFNMLPLGPIAPAVPVITKVVKDYVLPTIVNDAPVPDEEKQKAVEATKEDKETQGPQPGNTETVDFVNEQIQQSVGKGGVNNAKDVKIVQQNLVVLGYLGNGAEVAAVNAMANDATVQESALVETIKAIKNYQKYALVLNSPDGNIGAGGLTWTHLSERMEMQHEYSSHTVETQPINQVLSNSQWISQFKDGQNVKTDGTIVNMSITGEGRGLLDSEKARADKSNYVCCWDAAKAMTQQAGGTISTDKTTYLQTMFQKDGVNHTPGGSAELGVKYIDKNLLSGKPVMIGVDDGRTASYNYDGTTEHYIVIVGKVIKDGKIYYRFFDPGSAHGATKGYAETNLLYMGEDYQLTGDKPGSSRDYTMSHVRTYQ